MNKYNFNQSRLYSGRYLFIYTLIGLVLVFYIYRLFNLQIIQGEQFLANALNNRSTVVHTPTERGIVYDRNMYILAHNVPSYNVVITPAYLPGDTGAVQDIYRQLSELLGVPVSKGDTGEATVRSFTPCVSDLGIEQVVVIGDTNWPYSPIEIKCNVDAATAMVVREHSADWPGVGIEIQPVRDYPTGNLTSEIIGFLGPIPASSKDKYESLGFVTGRDKIGYAGIEDWFQEELGGKNGLRQVEQDVAGKDLGDLVPPVDPIPGQNVVLTIDTRLQSVARAALTTEINFWNTAIGKKQMPVGVVIAMNPKTGEILSLVSYPNYENNRMARIIPGDYYTQLINDPDRPLFNHAISAEQPPGSVFKIAAAIGALNEGVVTPEQQLTDPGKISIIQKFYENDPGTPRDFVCWKRDGHGIVDFIHGVAFSCDVYFYKIGGGYAGEVEAGLGPWRLSTYARALGWGDYTGIELAGEAKGNIPDPKWKRITLGENWSTGDTYIGTIGQGYVLSTVVQVLQAYQTVANDGKAMKLTLLKEILGANGTVITPFTPVQRWDITSDPVIQAYQDIGFNNEIPLADAQGNLIKKTVAPWVIKILKEGLHLVNTEGTAKAEFENDTNPIVRDHSAGKTGTAEYCDDIARKADICKPGQWPAHAWYAGYAPMENPEILVVAYVYHGTEGSTVAGPIVQKVLDAYFELKALDAAKSQPAAPNQPAVSQPTPAPTEQP